MSEVAELVGDEMAMINGIIRDETDVVGRAIYADWLDDQGRCEEAELFRRPLADQPTLLIWKTSDGEKVLVHRMTDKHLLYAVRYLENRALTFRRDGYSVLVKEVERRGLKFLPSSLREE